MTADRATELNASHSGLPPHTRIRNRTSSAPRETLLIASSAAPPNLFLVTMGAVSRVVRWRNVANMASRARRSGREIPFAWHSAPHLAHSQAAAARRRGAGFIGPHRSAARARRVRMSTTRADPGNPMIVLRRTSRVRIRRGDLRADRHSLRISPAVHVSKTSNNDVLKEGGRGSVGNRRVRWFSGSIVVAELALSLVLLAGAGLMVRSFMKLYTLDVGFPIDHLMTMRMRLPESRYADPEARRGFFERLEPRLAAIPGVEAVAMTTGVPPLDGGERPLEIDGRTPEETTAVASRS